MNEQLQKRKNIRIKDYDYSADGVYFITICTKNKEKILSSISIENTNVKLTSFGKIVEKHINNLNDLYKHIDVFNYVIMPNHIHLIVGIGITNNISLSANDGSPRAVTPTIPKLVNALKSLCSKNAGFSMWQRNYYEHIIRNEHEYNLVYKYVEENPLAWIYDKYY